MSKRRDASPDGERQTPQAPSGANGSKDLGLEVWWHEQAWNLATPVTPRPASGPVDLQAETARAERVTSWAGCWLLNEEPFDGIPTEQQALVWTRRFLDFDARGSDAHSARLRYQADPGNIDPFMPGPLRCIIAHILGGRPVRHYAECLDAEGRDATHAEPLLSMSAGADVLTLRSVWSVVPQRDKKRLAKALRGPLMGPHAATTGDVGARPFLAAVVGGREDDIRRFLADIADGHVPCGEFSFQRANALPLLAPTPAERVAVARRIRACPWTSEDLLIPWLVATGPYGLDDVLKAVLDRSRSEAEGLLRILTSRLHGPGAVPFFAALVGSVHGAAAAQWLRSHVPQIFAADLTDDEAAQLTSVLRGLGRDTLRVYREQSIHGIRREVDQILAEVDQPTFDPSTPWWSDTAPDAALHRDDYLAPSAVPALEVDGARLAPEQTATLLAALRTADPDEGLLRAVRQNVPAAHRDRFALGLLEMWLNHGARTRDSWVMVGAGCVGGDGYAESLAEQMQAWPGQSQFQRAVYGLQGLVNVGSDGAVGLISDIAATAGSTGLRKRASAVLEELAQARGLTRQQLEDRVVGHGQRGEHAAATLCVRYEKAMVDRHRWSAADFTQHVAAKPVVQRTFGAVVWAIYEGEQRVALGRVTPDGGLVDAAGAPVDVAGREVGIIHPVEATAAELETWREVLASHALVEAFPQVNRATFAIPDGQGDDMVLHGIPPGEHSLRGLRHEMVRRGWERGEILDNGVYPLLARYFEAFDVTAVLHIDPGFDVDAGPFQAEQELGPVYLLAGHHDPRAMEYGWEPGTVPALEQGVTHVAWNTAPAIVTSEVMDFVNTLTSDSPAGGR